jgi:hypothetical protein
MGPQSGLRLDIADNAPMLVWFEQSKLARLKKAYGEAE